MAIGNFMEWFDFSVFGAQVDIISDHFFPGDQSSTRFLKTVAVFGAGFVMRPLGGVFVGWIGDTLGRRRALEVSILLMLFPSFLIGCLPTFDQIGWWAPALLVLLRLVQGLAAGGELVGAMIFTLESTDGSGVGYWGGACKATGNLGSTLGIGVAAVLRAGLSAEQLHSWGWRLPFLLGLGFGALGLYARRSLDQVDSHGAHGESESAPITPYATLVRALLTEHRADILSVVAVAALWGCGYYTCFVWLAYYMSDPELLGRQDSVPHAWLLCFVANLLLVVALPLGGMVGDLWVHSNGSGERGRRHVLLLAVLLLVAVVLPALVLLRTRLLGAAALGMALLVAPLGLFGGNLPVYMVTHFERSLRFTGVGIAYNLAHALFSSSVALVQTSLIVSAQRGGAGQQAHLLPGYYLLCVCLLAAAALHLDTGVPHSLGEQQAGGGEEEDPEPSKWLEATRSSLVETDYHLVQAVEHEDALDRVRL